LRNLGTAIDRSGRTPNVFECALLALLSLMVETTAKAQTSTPRPSDAPEINIAVDPKQIAPGGYATVSWRAVRADSCVAESAPAYSGWAGAKEIDWSQSVAPGDTTELVLVCTNSAGSARAAATLTVGEGRQAREPSPEPTPEPIPEAIPARGPSPTPTSEPLAAPPPEPLPGQNVMLAHVPANLRAPLEAGFVQQADLAMGAALTGYEPWLFDRATVFYKLGRWTSQQRFTDHGLTLARQYCDLLRTDGQFSLKPNDAKYSYVDPAIVLAANGDKSCIAKAGAVFRWWLTEFPVAYHPSQAMWTEREAAYALASAIGWHELTGDPEALSRARALVQQWATMAAETGAPLHTLEQHQEDFGEPYGPMRMTSPWMSALWFEYLQRYYRTTQDEAALQMASRYGDFLIANCLYDGRANHPNLSGYLLPYYLCGANGAFYDRETPSEGDGEHTPDVMGLMAFVVYAKRQLGQDSRSALDAYTRLQRSAAYFVGRRQTAPNPPRKINWWIGTTYDYGALVR
jgi:hypothetical protein